MNNSISIDGLLNRLDKVRPNGHEKWKACCPGHDDRNPSLSISTGDDGRILLHCFAGCSIENITAALGISTRDLFVDGDKFYCSMKNTPDIRETSLVPSASLSKRKLVDVLEHELFVQCSVIGHYKQRKIPDPQDKGRDRQSAIRIKRALEVLYDL